MEKTKKFGKLLAFCAVAVAVIASCFLFGCTDKEPVKADENTVVITADSKGFDFEGKTLIDYMNFLQEKGKLTFEEKDGMVTSINGKAQSGSSYWMIYTNDTENADAEYGLEYEGATYGSAKVGVKELPVKKDCLYIFAYQTF